MNPKIIIISTRDDYDNFAQGISGTMEDSLRGYMDFGGLRGKEALSSPVRAMELPKVKHHEIVDTVIVAKSVLATGCTVVNLLRKAIEMYDPKNIIVASIFYSNEGIRDLKIEVRDCKIYVCGKPDALNKDGMLIPGVGNLDERLKTNIN